jgi:hypothetical protein
MDKTKIGVIAATAILGLGALGGAAVKANANSNPVKSAASTVAAAVTANPEADAGMPDTDTLQQGDQTTPDTAADATAEQAGSEAPGNDGPGGHADDPGNANVDHQFEGVE